MLTVRPCFLNQLHRVEPIGIIDDNMVMDRSFRSDLRYPNIFQLGACSLEYSPELLQELRPLRVCLLDGFRAEILLVRQDNVKISFVKVLQDKSLNFLDLVSVILSLYLLGRSLSLFCSLTSGRSIITRIIFLDLPYLSQIVSNLCVQKPTLSFPVSLIALRTFKRLQSHVFLS